MGQVGPGGSPTNFSSLTPVWILTPPDPASAVTETLCLRDPARLKFVLTSRQVWEVDADGPSSWAPQNTWPVPAILLPASVPLTNSAQNVPCKQDHRELMGRARHTAVQAGVSYGQRDSSGTEDLALQGQVQVTAKARGMQDQLSV